MAVGFNNTPNYYVDSITNSNIPEKYTRNPEWTAAPTLIAGDVYFLLRIDSNDDFNWFNLKATGGTYTIDWGDGSSILDTYASGTTYEHQYTFSSIVSPVNSDGYKTVWARVTSVNTLTNITLPITSVSDTGSLVNRTSTHDRVLELYINNVNLTSFTNIHYLNNLVYCYLGLNSFSTYTQLFSGSSTLGIPSLQKVDITYIPNAVTVASYMFQNCYNLLEVVFPNSSNNITNFTNLFQYCYKLNKITNLYTNNGTFFTSMFSNCTSLVIAPSLNYSSVTNTSNMFYYCRNLAFVPNIVSAPLLTTSSYMFQYCFNLKAVSLPDLPALTTATSMFQSCNSLLTVTIGNLPNLVTATSMFQDCLRLLKVSTLNIPLCTAAGSMFNGCTDLLSIDITNTSNITTGTNMFLNCRNLKTVTGLQTDKFTSIQTLFSGCLELESIPSNLNLPLCTNISSAFQFCVKLNMPITLTTSASLTNISSVFAYCYSLSYTPVITNTINVTTISGPFLQCYSLTEIPQLNCINFPALSLDGLKFIKNIKLYNVVNNVTFTSTTGVARIDKTGLEDFFKNGLTSNVSGKSFSLSTPHNTGGIAETISKSNLSTSIGGFTFNISDTSRLKVGMQIEGPASPLTTGISVTFTDSTNLVTLANHGLENGDLIAFSAITGTTGITIKTYYYVINKTTNDFQISNTIGGAALDLTTDGSGTMKYITVITEITTNVFCRVSRPFVAGGTQSHTFRELLTGYALLKGWTVG